MKLTKLDMDFLKDTSFIQDLTDAELLDLMGTNQYKDGYKVGVALAEEYSNRFLQGDDCEQLP